MISTQNNMARQNQKAQGQGLATGYAREYIKFDSSRGGECSSFFYVGQSAGIESKSPAAESNPGHRDQRR